MAGILSLMQLGGHALFQALVEVCNNELGPDSELSIAAKAALKNANTEMFENVQRALQELPSDTQERILYQAHQKMVLSGFGVLGDWPAQQLGERNPTKH